MRAILAAACAALCLGAQVCAQGQLQAGAARVSITPDPAAARFTLGGYGDVERFTHAATGVHDTCYARALVLARGRAKCALVSLDLCYLPANLQEAVARRVASTGMPASGLLLSATHTHSAPEPLLLHSGNTGGPSALPKFDPALLEWFVQRIASAIWEADGALRPARLGGAQARGIGLNRNRRGENLTDDELTILKVSGADGRAIAGVLNYAAHPTYYGASMLQVSGDWAGAFERKMEAQEPGAVMLFVNGAEGDASPNGADAGTAEEKVDAYSSLLAGKAARLWSSTAAESDPPLAAWAETVDLPARKPHPLFALAAMRFGATPAQTTAYVERLMPQSCSVSFLRAGSVLFIGFPGEPTAAIGLQAKAAARARGVSHPAVLALTNGWLGYILTPEQYRAGKYEATMSFLGDQVGPRLLKGVQAGLAGPERTGLPGSEPGGPLSPAARDGSPRPPTP